MADGEPMDEAAAADGDDGGVDIEELQAELDAAVAKWQGGDGVAAAEELWRRFEGRVSGLAQELCEQLRLVLEPTLASKLQGDYRTGKRIAMRKVIPYIASGFRKDKIWLRRTKRNKRQYQVVLCIDDSESMRAYGAGALACEALALICGALSRLEVGELAVLSFAERVSLLHPFDAPFTAEAGARMLSNFTFAQKHTQMEALLRDVVSMLGLARATAPAASAEQLQLCLIVSDGRKMPSWGDPAPWIRKAKQEHILLCFVIVDAAEEKDSILEMQNVAFEGGKLVMSRYLDTAFPFPFYLVLRDLSTLPVVLSDALRQWFELLQR